jgi:predicted amidophosphoribosyltransferase
LFILQVVENQSAILIAIAKICRFCWHRLKTDSNGLCPACRKPYSDNPAHFEPLSEDEYGCFAMNLLWQNDSNKWLPLNFKNHTNKKRKTSERSSKKAKTN